MRAMSETSQRKSILVVEDEPFVRFDLVDFFEDRGFRVLSAGNADEAIRVLEQHEETGVSSVRRSALQVPVVTAVAAWA